jgi:hypothetical protein
MSDSAMLRMWVDRAARGDRDAEARALEAMSDIVLGIAKEWYIPGLELGDVFQEAQIAAVRAIREFDPARGESVAAFVRKVVPRHLGHVKDSAMRRRAEPLADEIIEQAVAAPAQMTGDDDPLDPDVLRSVWHYLTEAERRGVVVVLMETDHATAAHLADISKQAINKGWRSAQAVIRLAHEQSPEAAVRGRRMVGSLQSDWQLDYALERHCRR